MLPPVCNLRLTTFEFHVLTISLLPQTHFWRSYYRLRFTQLYIIVDIVHNDIPVTIEICVTYLSVCRNSIPEAILLV